VSAAPFTLSASEVARAAGAGLTGPAGGAAFSSVSTDSRAIRAGDLFVAVPGPRFDGHAFVGEAVARGAGGVVVSEASAATAVVDRVPVFVVPDTVAALQAVARHVRERSGATVVAITGSAGKTTTKEAIAALLETRFRTIRNRGNLNNHIGLPLSLIELTGGAEVAVVELGMNHAGEISRLVSIARPDVRVWTNVGTAHIEYFGTMDAIADAKAEILEGGERAVLVANADDPLVMDRARRFGGRTLTFGIERPASVRATDIDDRGFDGVRAAVATPVGPLQVESPLAGRGHLLNVLAAVTVGVHFDVPLRAMAERVRTLAPAPHRGEVLRLSANVTVVDDCYNASPSALRELLRTTAGDRVARRRVAFFGEMLELGASSEALHRECGAAAAAAGLAALVTVGGLPAQALGAAAVAAGLDPAQVAHVASSEDAAAMAHEVVRPGDLVLVKGSRGIRMERVVERLAAEYA
jgi:UDP-N-acetylmuramoyl-tripeptide--D-alanyl-D-alanine ligase